MLNLNFIKRHISTEFYLVSVTDSYVCLANDFFLCFCLHTFLSTSVQFLYALSVSSYFRLNFSHFVSIPFSSHSSFTLFAPFLEGVGMHKACCRCLPSNLPIHLFAHFSRQFIYHTNENTPVQLNPSPVNPVIHVQLKLPGEFVQLANSLQFP